MKFKQCNHTNLSKISLTRKTNKLHTLTAVPNSKLFIHQHFTFRKQEIRGPHRSPEKHFLAVNKLEQSYMIIQAA